MCMKEKQTRKALHINVSGLMQSLENAMHSRHLHLGNLQMDSSKITCIRAILSTLSVLLLNILFPNEEKMNQQ